MLALSRAAALPDFVSWMKPQRAGEQNHHRDDDDGHRVAAAGLGQDHVREQGHTGQRQQHDGEGIEERARDHLEERGLFAAREDVAAVFVAQLLGAVLRDAVRRRAETVINGAGLLFAGEQKSLAGLLAAGGDGGLFCPSAGLFFQQFHVLLLLWTVLQNGGHGGRRRGRRSDEPRRAGRLRRIAGLRCGMRDGIA
jgi:hypothetical protein